MIRLCLTGPFDPEIAPDGLVELLARACDAPDFGSLEAELVETERKTGGLCRKLIRRAARVEPAASSSAGDVGASR